MTLKEEKVSETEKPCKNGTEEAKDKGTGAGEFNVTVRKLKVPVRPRGVLAD